MNIREAKEEIKKSVEICLDKNEFGEYAIPASKQRPIFMAGPPGIGKNAVMQQIASELDIALVSCSMAHHTRQSAFGRFVIESRDYGGKKTAVSEYTMSEIIVSIYRVMQDSGKREGILFLDEINCIPDTMAPAIKQFLQYKTLGNRRVPEGWAVVTAGSLPQYNKTVKEFDVSSMDHVKRIDITEDFSVWKPYACQQGVHAAVLTFLEINPRCFFTIRSAEGGMQYATARGWEDLSTAIHLYERKGYEIHKKLIGQYITEAETAEAFAGYYDLYRKCGQEYAIKDILSGKISREMLERSQRAKREERFAVLGLIMERLGEGLQRAISREQSLRMAAGALSSIENTIRDEKIPISLLIQEQTDGFRKQLRERTAANCMMEREREEYFAAIRMLEEYEAYPETKDCKKDFEKIKKQFGRAQERHENQVGQMKSMQESAFSFLHKAWGNQEELIGLLRVIVDEVEKTGSSWSEFLL